VFAIDVSTRSMTNGTTVAAIGAVRAAIRQLAEMDRRERINRAVIHTNQPASLSGHSPSVFFADELEIPTPIKVGILTFDSHVQFYSVKSNRVTDLQSPFKIMVCDPNEPLCPIPISQWLMDVSTKFDQVDYLLEQLPELLANGVSQIAAIPREIDEPQHSIYLSADMLCCPMAAIRAVQLGLEACGGRLYVLAGCHSTCGFGKLPVCREKFAAYGTSNESSLYSMAAAKALATISVNQIHGGSTMSAVLGAVTVASSTVSAAMVGSSSDVRRQQSHQPSAERDTLVLSAESLSQSEFLASECNRCVVCVNVIACLGGDSITDEFFFDTSTLGELSNKTGGRLFVIDGSLDSTGEHHNCVDMQLRMCEQLLDSISASVAAEVVMKLRTSVGICVDSWVPGPGSTSGKSSFGSDDEEMVCAGIDANTTVCIKLKHDSSSTKMRDEERVHLQLAVLCTTLNSAGESSEIALTPSRSSSAPLSNRRIVRVHNLTLLASSRPSLIFRNSDIETVAVVLMKESTSKALFKGLFLNDMENGNGLTSVEMSKYGPRSFLDHSVVLPLMQYRINCSANSPKGQLILPESLKVLPVYALGMLKHPSLLDNQSNSSKRAVASHASVPGSIGMVSNRNISSPLSRIAVRGHMRAYELLRMVSLPVREIINSIYPRVYNLIEMFQFDHELLLSSNDCMDGMSACASIDRDDLNDVAEMRVAQERLREVSKELISPGKIADHLARQLPVYADIPVPSLSVAPRGPNNGMNTSLSSMLGDLDDIRRPTLAQRLMQRTLLTECASSEIFESDGVYLLDDRSSLWIYIGRSVSRQTLEDLFDPFLSNNVGRGTFSNHRPSLASLNTASELGSRVNAFVGHLRSSSSYKQGICSQPTSWRFFIVTIILLLNDYHFL
jgi:hypothetical protein